VAQPLGLSAASADDLKELIATTIKHSGEKPFCFLFTILLGLVAAPASQEFPNVASNE
jgi:hypothetical protein